MNVDRLTGLKRAVSAAASEQRTDELLHVGYVVTVSVPQVAPDRALDVGCIFVKRHRRAVPARRVNEDLLQIRFTAAVLGLNHFYAGIDEDSRRCPLSVERGGGGGVTISPISMAAGSNFHQVRV